MKRDDFRALLPADKRERTDLESALETVRYWFHDVLILHNPMTPPRRILQVVERALGVA